MMALLAWVTVRASWQACGALLRQSHHFFRYLEVFVLELM